jgi:hypothetical protein
LTPHAQAVLEKLRQERQCPECGGKRNRHILPYRKAK